MRTLVCQSYRSDDVPSPIRRCLASVEGWAAAAGYAYRFHDDRLFELAPNWFKEAVGHRKLPMADLARLLLAKEALASDFDRFVWIDADVLVFAPENFTIDVTDEYAFGREVWVRRGGRDKLLLTEGLHNAVCVFIKNNSVLDFYIHAIYEIARGLDGPCLDHQFGPDLLSRIGDIVGPRTLPDVGLFSPVVTLDIANGGGRATESYMRAHGQPIAAANLCASFLDRESSGVTMTAEAMDRAIDRLLETGGDVVNGVLEAAPSSDAGL